MNNKDKSKNPEIEREKRIKNDALYDDDYPMMLFPCEFMGSTASATESTGLIQNPTVVNPSLSSRQRK